MVNIVKQKHWWTLHVIQKWDTGRNKTGQPRKGISMVNHELKERWYEPATKADIQENYMAMIQLSEPELKPLMTDMTKPILVRIIAKNLLDKKGFDIIERMIDRAHGKAIIVGEGWDDRWQGTKDQIFNINVITINDRKQSPGFTGITCVPEKLSKQKKD